MDGHEARVRLLMVDDEEEFLASTSKVLRRRGIDVVVARNGQEALQAAKQKDIEVVVLDVKMPGMDGVEVFGQLKLDRPGLPVIMLTGHGTIPQAFEMSKAGVFDYLSKPCDPDELAAKVRDAAEQARNAPGPAGEAEGSGPAAGPFQVLLIDDERQFLESFRKVLERRGMQVHTAENGKEGLDLLRNTAVDVVVLDVKMPGMDGLEVLRRIKKKYHDLEVILLTGHPTVEIAVQGIKLGAFEYMVKPPDVDTLTDLIRKAFHRTLVRRQKETIRKVLRRHPF